MTAGRLAGRLLLVAALLGSTGCATVLAGGPTPVAIALDGPADATITARGLDADDRVDLPAGAKVLALPRRIRYAVVATAPDHEPAIAIVGVEPDPWVWVNFVPAVMAGATALVLYVPLGGMGPLASNTGGQFGMLAVALFLGGTAGFWVDALTGAGRLHTTNRVELVLKRRGTEPPK